MPLASDRRNKMKNKKKSFSLCAELPILAKKFKHKDTNENNIIDGDYEDISD